MSDYGYWSRIYEDPELYAAHFHGSDDGDDDYYDEHGKDADYGW